MPKTYNATTYAAMAAEYEKAGDYANAARYYNLAANGCPRYAKRKTYKAKVREMLEHTETARESGITSTSKYSPCGMHRDGRRS